MNKRKPLSKKVRFEVFKRDSFTCAYCGITPPNVVLEVDHITPVSKGGENNEDNLITSCFNCNRGKSDIELTNVPTSIKDKHEILIEKNNQIVEYNKLIKKIERRAKKQLKDINNVFTEWFEGEQLTDKFLNSSVKMFIDKINYLEVKDAMHLACSKKNWNSGYAAKYFCGICWSKIKGDDYGY